LIDLLVVDIIKETENANSYILKDINNSIKNFYPGQYITLVIDNDKENIKRSYSVSSLPNILPLLKITIKHNNKSLFYTEFANKIKIGDIIKAEKIAGNFYIKINTTINNFLFIAAGSGITPIFSMINQLLEERKDVNIKLIYQNRNENVVIYNKELKNLQSVYKNFEVEYYYSQPINFNSIVSKKLNSELLTILYLKNKEFLSKSEIYVCGPDKFIEIVFNTFKNYGINENRLKREVFNTKSKNNKILLEI